MAEEPTPSPIRVNTPAVNDHKGTEILEYIQQKTGAPGVILILLSQRLDENSQADAFQYTQTYTIGIAPQWLKGVLHQVADYIKPKFF